MVVEASHPDIDSTVLMYGHNDKQPHMVNEWSEGLYPAKAVQKGDKLYGRGGADDGYAFLASVTMIKMLQDSGARHPKFVIFAENDEESGSNDIMYHLDKFKDDIGNPDLIVC